MLRTNKAGLYAFQQASEDILGCRTHLEGVKTAGMTDYYIAGQIVRAALGREPEQHEITRLLNRYEELLPAELVQRQGSLMPSVLEILTAAHNHPAFVSLLLTGNTLTGAKSKLSFFHIEHYFDFSRGAFCTNCSTRSEIAARAREIVQKHYGHLPAKRVFVIGDTPHDIDCGKFIGAHTIAVSTGTFNYTDLSIRDPWWALPTLPPWEQFREKIESRA